MDERQGSLPNYYSTSVEPFLRAPPSGLARSAYAVEINPWVRRGDVEAALMFRGTIVSAYGYIETRMGELAIRCSKLDIYASIRASYPFQIDKRLAYLRKVFSVGPLLPYTSIATQFFERFESAAELRHQVAHARMQVLPDWGVTFHDLPKSGPGEITLRSNRKTLKELELLAWRAARISRLSQHLLDRLNRSGIVPPLDSLQDQFAKDQSTALSDPQ